MRIALRTQWKVTLLAAVVLIGAVSAVMWKTQSLILEDKLSFINDAAVKQIGPIKRLAQERLEEHKSKLVKATSERLNFGKGRLSSDFEIVAMVQPADGGQWSPQWVEKNVHAKKEQWGHELAILKSLPYAKVKDGETIWTRVSDRQGAPAYALLMSVEIQSAEQKAAAPSSALPDGTDYGDQFSTSAKKAVVVGISTFNPLAALTEDYIGSINNVYLVDDRGYVASHVNKAYLGALFTEDPLVKDVVKTKRSASTGRYEDIESRDVLGHFERIDRTNLFAAITTPYEAATGILTTHFRAAMLAAGAFGLVGLFLAWTLGGKLGGQTSAPAMAEIDEEEMKEIEVTAPQLTEAKSEDEEEEMSMMPLASAIKAVTKAFSAPISFSPAIPVPLAEKIPAVALPATVKTEEEPKRDPLSDGFVAAVREPLLAVLGHAQLAKVKSEKDDVRGHAESIEREARKAKEVLEKLKTWKDEAQPTSPDETFDLADIVNDALETAKEEIEEEGIQVVTLIDPVPRIHGAKKSIEDTVKHLLDNAREAMMASKKKTLRIRVEMLGDEVSLRIADTGVGMSRDVKERAFEPFFKEFESPMRLGLGLTVVSSTVKRQGGKIEVASAPGEGATFTVTLPVSGLEKMAFRAQQEAKAQAASHAEAERVAEALRQREIETSERELEAAAKRACEPSYPFKPALAGKNIIDLNLDDEDDAFDFTGPNASIDALFETTAPKFTTAIETKAVAMPKVQMGAGATTITFDITKIARTVEAGDITQANDLNDFSTDSAAAEAGAGGGGAAGSFKVKIRRPRTRA